MTIIELLRLLRKHFVLLLLLPIILAGLVMFMTKNPSFTYSSDTTLYTGIASGSSVEMDKSFSYYANNTAFDNLINVISSRETQQEVAISLLAQHLMLAEPDPLYISKKSFEYVRKITPPYILSLVAKSDGQSLKSEEKKLLPPADTAKKIVQKVENMTHTVRPNETLFSISRQYGISVEQIKDLNGLKDNGISVGKKLTLSKSEQPDHLQNTHLKDTLALATPSDSNVTFSFSKLYASTQKSKALPSSINQAAFEQTVKNLTAMLRSSDTNFVYRLLNHEGLHYSLISPTEISSIKSERIGSSDLVKLKFTSDDPGICQQTLIFFTSVLIKNYKEIKENRSDAVIKYFEYQVSQATQRLKIGEDKLLNFNKEKNIINYYEQSKAVAIAKEALDVDYNNMKIKLAGIDAGIKRLEDKLEKQQIIQLKTAPVIEKRNQLSQINTKIATAENFSEGNPVDIQNLAEMKVKAEKLKDGLRDAVGELYRFNSTTEGMPTGTLLTDWLTHVVNYEETKAGLAVLGKRIEDFQKVYEVFAPAGANLKRIEREISVSEQAFLELLHGLNLARLKMQDIELSSNLKAIDEPFYPLTPNPTKRSLLIVGAALLGFIVVLSSVMALNYFDETLRNPQKAAQKLNLLPLGIFPKIYLKPGVLNFPFIADRLLEMTVQRIELLKKSRKTIDGPYQILLFSTVNNEGKTVIAQNLATQLKKLGNKVLIIRYLPISSDQISNQKYCAGAMINPEEQTVSPQKFSFIRLMFGYEDNRVDYKSDFICDNGPILAKDEIYEYEINEEFHPSVNYKDLLIRNGHLLSFIPDYVLIKIPPILYFPYPPALVASADLPLMVCRANRVWSEADQGAIENFSKLTSCAPMFFLNGVELDVIESVLGDLQKKRSWFRKIVKKLVRFQFFASNRP